MAMTYYKNKKAGDKALEIITSIVRALFLLGMAYVLLYPVLFLLSNAFRDPIDRLDPTVIWIPKTFTLNNFFLSDQILGFLPSIMKTLSMLIPSVIIQVFICLMVAYGFARFNFKFKELLFSCLLFTIIVPVQTMIIPLYVNFRFFDFFGIGKILAIFNGGEAVTVKLLNTNWPFYLMSLTGTGIRSGLYIFMVRQFFKSMPVELEESAFVDGCGPFKTFMKIMLPNVGSIVIVITLFSIVWHWNDFYLSVMFYIEEYPLSVSVTMLQERLTLLSQNMSAEDMALAESSLLEAACFVVIAPVLLLYIFAQRYFTESITRTGIVG
ncbi:MAG TPA: carbohydrate ABC transporter permease [Treponemataceae bacterium]|nr:carbohydrate ABC transporter permease [Treponemataceae bacterium]HQL03698.1 carbohydrate ABC transporter permease [Treponemataceae bacterium]